MRFLSLMYAECVQIVTKSLVLFSYAWQCSSPYTSVMFAVFCNSSMQHHEAISPRGDEPLLPLDRDNAAPILRVSFTIPPLFICEFV